MKTKKKTPRPTRLEALAVLGLTEEDLRLAKSIRSYTTETTARLVALLGAAEAVCGTVDTLGREANGVVSAIEDLKDRLVENLQGCKWCGSPAVPGRLLCLDCDREAERRKRA